VLISFFKGAVSGPISYRYFSDEESLYSVGTSVKNSEL
jgi:hypothetical protein